MAYFCRGGVLSKIRQESERQRRRHDEIELELAESNYQESMTIKMLLLGSGESGKSTILKQMKLIYNQMTEADYVNVMPAIYSNIIDSMGIILVNMINLGIPFEDPERVLDRTAVFDVIDYEEQMNRFTFDVFEGLLLLWKDKGVQECYEKRNQYYLLDSAKYFLDNLLRIYSSDYMPTTQDLLYVRRQTTGIVKVEFSAVVSKCTLRVVDVGGQQTERRKWLHCFDNVNCVIFISAISEFDQNMLEDNKTNRMVDSLTLFKHTVSSVYFREACIVLFLNKIDLFKEKLQSNISIKLLFPDYTGGQNYDQSLEYVRDRFKEKRPEGKIIYIHPTCATDTEQVQKVIRSCTDMVIRANLNGSAFS